MHHGLVQPGGAGPTSYIVRAVTRLVAMALTMALTMALAAAAIVGPPACAEEPAAVGIGGRWLVRDGEKPAYLFYHDHKYPTCVKSPFADDGRRHSPVIGFAFDGFPIHGPYESEGVFAMDLEGERALDVCNGHADDERGYHYHVTTSRRGGSPTSSAATAACPTTPRSTCRSTATSSSNRSRGRAAGRGCSSATTC